MSEEQTELAKRLEAARQKKRAASARLEATAEEIMLEEVEREEIEAEGEEALAKAVEDHGRKKVGVVRTYAGWLVLKRPNHILWRRFQDAGEYTTKAVETMVRKCIVYPNAARVDSIFEEIPNTILKCGSTCTDLAHGRIQDLSGK